MNRAASIGPSKFDWWPDWRDECVAIIASGSSTKSAKVELTKDRIHVIAIKKNIELCPWSEVVYGCDEPWWSSVNGLPKYRGVKLSQAPAACGKFKDLHRIEVKNINKILLDVPCVVGSGRNSGFQALNIAIQFGATGILLVGYDMQGEHWYGRNTWRNSTNPIAWNFERWVKAFHEVANDIKQMGIDVVDASLHGGIKCFRKATVEKALSDWGL